MSHEQMTDKTTSIYALFAMERNALRNQDTDQDEEVHLTVAMQLAGEE